MIEGRIVCKKKRKGDVVVITLKPLPPDPNKKIIVDRSNSSMLEFCYIGATIRVLGQKATQPNQVLEEEELNDDDVILPSRVQLVRCAADTHAVEWAMAAIVEGTVPTSVLPNWTPDMLEGRRKRAAVAQIVRRLRGGEMEERKGPRIRKPHIAQAERQVVERIETNEQPWKLFKPMKRDISVDDENEDIESLKNFPECIDSGAAPLKASGQPGGDYLHGKKEPQIRWIKERIRQMPLSFRHIVDVGGGRGELGASLALDYPLVTVVDKNRISLESGESHAQQLGCADHMNFVHADFSNFSKDPSLYLNDYGTATTPSIDLVVALHACGDLSDLALDFASRHECPFVVCPCCFTRHLIPDLYPPWYHAVDAKELEVLQRLAERENRDMSQRAMMIVNSLRLHYYFVETCNYTPNNISLEEYPSTYSLRNYVLVGH